jgi:putative DNA primase/helicase
VLFLSSGEVGLAEHMREAGKQIRAGQELRMVDIPADAGAGLGIFESLHGFADGHALARHIEESFLRIHGTAGRQWLELLVTRTEGLSKAVRGRIAALETTLVPPLASGQVRRVGRRFALIAAAGEMATEAGLTGWPQGEATRAAGACLGAWIAARGGIGASEDAAILRQVRLWFGLHGEARFTDWARADDDHAPKTMNRAGWRRAVKDPTGELVAWEWFILPEVFRAEVCKGYSHTAALALLKGAGHLVPAASGRYDRRESPPGAAKCNLYRIKSSVLSEHDEED